ncbi:hypothetical protein SRHO_G00082610 [Serrasalmus rhombeus]
MIDLSTVLAELRSLCSEFSGFGTKLDSIDNRMAKTDDLENRGRRKNLRLFGLREGAEGQRPLLEFIREMLEINRSFVTERAHRTLASPKPNQHRAILIQFLNFQDREFVFRSTKQRDIEHDRIRLFFAQDFLAETIRRRAEFSINQESVR